MCDPTVVVEVASLAAVVKEGIALEAAPGRVQRLQRVDPTGRPKELGPNPPWPSVSAAHFHRGNLD